MFPAVLYPLLNVSHLMIPAVKVLKLKICVYCCIVPAAKCFPPDDPCCESAEIEDLRLDWYDSPGDDAIARE